MYPPSRRHGFTLIELLIVVVMIGILVALASPRIRRAFLRNEVRAAKQAMTNMYTTARLSAQQTGRNVAFQRVGNVLLITATPRLVAAGGSTMDTIGAVLDVGDRHGVTLSGTPTSIPINPKGLGGTAFKWLATRAEFSDSLTVSAFGRISR